MAKRRTRDCIAASGLVSWWCGKFLLFYRLFNAVFFVGPFAEVDHFAAFAAKWAEAVAGVPLVFFAALRAGDDGRFGHYEARLQKVSSNGTS